MDTIQPLLTCMVHQVFVLWTHARIRILVWSQYRSCVSRIEVLCFFNTDHRSCVSRIEILCFHNTDRRSCVSRIRILCLQNEDPRSCVSRIQILCIHHTDIAQYARMHHLRHVWASFKASMRKFSSSLVDLRQVNIFSHVGRHVTCILGTFLIRIWAKD